MDRLHGLWNGRSRGRRALNVPVAAFAQLTYNHQLMEWCRNRYKTVLIPHRQAPYPAIIRRSSSCR